jgi:hypothetical protein
MAIIRLSTVHRITPALVSRPIGELEMLSGVTTGNGSSIQRLSPWLLVGQPVPFVDKSASTNQLKTERTNAYDVKYRLGLGPYISRNTTSRSRAAYV